MKKFYSLILILAIFVSNFASVAVLGADNSISDVSRALSLLEDIGLADADEDISQLVTRDEFVGRIVRTLNVIMNYDYASSPFADTDVKNEYYYEICNALSLGIVSPSDNFRPDNPITYTEAVKTAVAACGYTFLADVYGGYPSGFVSVADRVGLSKGVSEQIDRGAMFVVMYNILNCKLPEQEYTGSGATNTLNAHKTVLQTMWHLEKISGTVDSAQYFGGDDGYGAGEGCFCVDGIKLRSGEFDTDKYFGYESDIYYDENYEAKSVYAYEKNKASDMLVLNSYDDVTFDSGSYTYFGSRDNKQTAKISPTALIVYNGKKSVYEKERMMPLYGNVRLIRDGGNEYTTVIINSYTQYVVEDISFDDMIISDHYDNKKTAVLTDTDYVSVRDQNGDTASFEDIDKYNVVWVALSDDHTLADIVISRDKIAGEYTGSASNGEIYIDGGMYLKDSNVTDDFMTGINYGEVIIAFFNANREIVYVETDSNSNSVNAAYLIRTGLFGSGMDKYIQAKLLNTDGSISNYRFAPKFRINGRVFEGDAKNLYDNILPRDSQYPASMPIGIISFNLNGDGEISVINYPDSLVSYVSGEYTNLYAKKTLDKTETDTKSWENYFQYRVSENSLYGKGVDRIFTTGDTVQFMVPLPEDTGLAEDSDYSVKPMSSYSGVAYLTKMRHTGYSASDEAYTSDYIVSAFGLGSGANTGSVSDAALAYLVTDVSKVITADGSEAEKLDAVDYQNRPITLYSDEEDYFDKAGVGVGSIIKAEFNTKNVVSGINVLYKAGDTVFCNTTDMSASEYTIGDDGATLNENKDMQTLSNSFLLLGNLWDKDDPIYSFLTMNHNPSDYDGTQPIYTYYMPKHITQFVCFNTKTQKVSFIKPSDVKCFGGINSNNHYAVLEMSYGMVDSVFLYE